MAQTDVILKYPIGVQNFESIRSENWLYVDKTALIHKLVTNGKYYFLSRPRRFGKSLLISTLEAYFQGKRELFKGLAIDKLTYDWEPRPVFHLDLNAKDYENRESLILILEAHLEKWEAIFGTDKADKTPDIRFAWLIRKAHEETGRKVAILIDEYDKPLISTIKNEPLQDTYRGILKGFYGVLKSCDADIQFAMLTGVTKFSKVSIFSDLNNLEDITLNDRFSTICGITPEELVTNFQPGINALSERLEVSQEQAVETLKNNYDGYHFSAGLNDVYNPYSLLCALKNSDIGDFWFETATPTYLADKLKESRMDLHELEDEKLAAPRMMTVDLISADPIPVLFQSGYLTIKAFDSKFRRYTLGYPNREVKEAFLNFLLPYYTPPLTERTAFDIVEFVGDVEQGRPESFMRRLSALFSGYPYDMVTDCELHYHNVIYLALMLMGFYVRAEYRTSDGRCDAVVQTDRFIYIFEFKYDKSAREALEQIERKNYAAQFAADPRTLFKIGVNFSPETHSINEYLIQ